MAGFSIQDAAFSGFAAVRRRPLAVIAWTALAFVVSLIIQGLAVGLPFDEVMAAWVAQDQARLRALSPALLLLDAKIAPVLLAYLVVMQGAIYRVILRGETDRWGSLRLGGDEIRLLGVTVVVWLLTLAAAILCGLALGLLVALLGGLWHAPLIPLTIVYTAAVYGVVALVALRLSLAAPLAFDTRRVDLRAAWRLTRAHAWTLLGTYVLAVALSAVVYALTLVLFYGAAGLALGGEMRSIASPPTSFAAIFAPARLILLVFGAFLSALIWPVLLAPAAVIYAALGSSRALAG
jgi:hypothetical protein